MGGNKRRTCNREWKDVWSTVRSAERRGSETRIIVVKTSNVNKCIDIFSCSARKNAREGVMEDKTRETSSSTLTITGTALGGLSIPKGKSDSGTEREEGTLLTEKKCTN